MLGIYIVAYVGLILLTWAIGSVNFAIITFYLRRGEDIRQKLSRNAGGSNIGRTLGKGWGILVVVLDMLKVPFAMTVALGFSFIRSGSKDAVVTNFWQVMSFYLVAGLVLLGHVWPVFFGFRGGKGVACFWGLTWVTNPWWFLIFALLWFGLYFVARRAFIASVGSIMITAVCAWIPQISAVDNLSLAYSRLDYLFAIKFIWFNRLHRLSTPHGGESFLTMQLVVTLTAAVIIVKHRSNMRQWYQQYKGRHCAHGLLPAGAALKNKF